jgi:hypothetical protein
VENIRTMRVHIEELNDCFSHEKGKVPEVQSNNGFKKIHYWRANSNLTRQGGVLHCLKTKILCISEENTP